MQSSTRTIFTLAIITIGVGLLAGRFRLSAAAPSSDSVQVYDVRTITSTILQNETAYQASLNLSPRQQVDRLIPRGNICFPTQPTMADFEPLNLEDASDRLQNLVLYSVTPDIWTTNGGLQGELFSHGQLLIVRAPPRAQEQTHQLLAQLSEHLP